MEDDFLPVETQIPCGFRKFAKGRRTPFERFLLSGCNKITTPIQLSPMKTEAPMSPCRETNEMTTSAVELGNDMQLSPPEPIPAVKVEG